jgi:hypothetical protein
VLSIGDFAFHPETRCVGKVIGYGHQILNDGYETTLKVLIVDPEGHIDRVEEDLISAWQKAEQQVAEV